MTQPMNMTTDFTASLETEKIVLGCMLSKHDCALAVRDVLQPEDFYFSSYREAYKVILLLIKKDIGVDVTNVYAEIVDTGRGHLEKNWVYFLTEACQSSAKSPYLDNYIDILRKKRIHRDLLFLLQEQTELVSQPVSDVFETIENLRQKLFKIDRNVPSPISKYDLDEFTKEFPDILEIHETYKKEGTIISKGIMTGYRDIDNLTQGLRPGNFVIIAARPSIGKTSLGLNIAYNMSQNDGLKSAFFSFEMGSHELTSRLISISSQVENQKIYSGKMTEDELERVRECGHKFKRDIEIFDEDERTISDIRRKARRKKETDGLDIIFIDYLGQIASSGKTRYENRNLEVSEISLALKQLAKSLAVPIVCLAQLSRKPEERQGGHPVLSDLRDSGSLEQDGDLIILLSRAPKDPGRVNHIVVNVAKQRSGPTDTFDMIYNPSTLTFFDNEIPGIDEKAPKSSSVESRY